DDFVADFHPDSGSNRCVLDRHVRQRDMRSNGQAWAAAGHGADGLTFIEHGVTMACDPFARHLEPDELSSEPLRLLTCEGLSADEVVAVELDDPREPGLERRCRLVDVV